MIVLERSSVSEPELVTVMSCPPGNRLTLVHRLIIFLMAEPENKFYSHVYSRNYRILP